MRTRDRAGVTLVETMIVVVMLGILAAVAVPQLSHDRDELHQVRLNAALVELRNAVDLYYHQHGNTYPGARSHESGAPVESPREAALAFVRQLTLYSDASGETRTTKDATHVFGPYLTRGLPANPLNTLATVACDIEASSIGSLATDGTTGWKFYVRTGRLIANDATR